MADGFLSDSDVGIGSAAPSAPPAGFMSDADVGIGGSSSKPAAAQTSSTAEDVAKSAGSGVVRGVAGAPFGLASLGSMGADAIVSGGDYLVRKALGLGEPSKEWKEKQAKAAAAVAASPIASAVPSAPEAGSAVQAGLTPYLHEPQTTAGKYAETVGEFAPMVALNPESLGSLGTAGGAAKTVGAMVAAPAIASETAGQATEGTAAEPYARMAGGILGGAAPGVAAKTVSNIAHAPTVAGALNKVGITRPAYDNAGQAFLKQAHDPQAVIDVLQNPPNPTAPAGPEQFQTMPGVNPTTFEATKDLGIGAAQRGDVTNNSAAYADILAKNNEARQAHLNSIEPDGHADEVVKHLNKQFDALHDQSTQAIDAAKANVPTQGAYQIEQGAPPEALGEAAQSHLGGLRSDVREAEGKLHQAVDPHGQLVSSVDPVDAAMREAYGTLSPTGERSMTPAENQFRDIAEEYMRRSQDGTIAYREMGDFDSMVGAAIRNERSENGSTPALRRMMILQGGIKDSLRAVARQVAHTDAQGVKAGVLDPNNALAARLRDVQGPQDVRSAQRSSQNDREGNGPLGTGQAQLPSGQGGTPSEGRGAVASGAGNPNVSGGAQAATAAPDPVAPPIRFEADPEVQARQRAANAATIDRVTRFDEGPVGDVLAQGKRAGEYKMPAASVPAKLFQKGPKGYTATKAYFDAAGNSPESASVMHDIAIGALADGAAKNGGNLTKAIVDKWKMEHAHSLRAIDEATPGFSTSYDERGSQFDNQQKALAEVERVTKEQNDRVAAHQKSVVGDILGARDQGDGALSARVRSMLKDQKDGVAKFQQLADAVEGNPDAKAGLRKVVADIMAEDLSKPEKQGTSDALTTKPAGAYRKTLEASAPKLRRIMTPEEMANYYKIADTLDDANMSLKANLPQGGPGSAHDKTQSEKLNGSHGGGHTGTAIVGALIGEQLLEHAAHFVPGYGLAAAGAVGTYAFLRRMGIRTGKELLSDALQHPDRAAIYVKAFTSNPNRAGRLNGILRKSFINQHKAPDDSGDQGPNEPPPSGPFSPNGRVDGNAEKASVRGVNENSINGLGASTRTDERGRIEPTLSPLDRGAEAPAQPVTPGNAPLTGRQARVLLADGHTPEAVRTMDHGARAAALQDALTRGVEPSARLAASDRDALGGAMPHRVHDGRSADGRFAEKPGGLEKPKLAMVGYHGSKNKNLSVISANPISRQFDNGTSALGAFVSPTKSGAERYAGEDGKIYQSNIALAHPYEMPVSEFSYLQDPTKSAKGVSLPGEKWAARLEELKKEGAQLRDRLVQKGHDGVIIRGPKGDIREISSFNDLAVH